MSDNDIVKMLRMIQGTSLPIRVWQHHMLRAASEIEQNRIDLEEYRRDVAKLTEERDRLKAALETKQTDPAPAVCEWTDHGTEWISQCKHRFDALASTKGRFFCQSCEKPIKFTEAKE